MTALLEHALPAQIRAELLRDNPVALQERLGIELGALIEADVSILTHVRSVLDFLRMRNFQEEDLPERETLSSLSTFQSLSIAAPGGLLAGDIPFGRPVKAMPSERPSKLTEILWLGASPRGESDLSIRDEAHCIDEAIQAGQFRDWFRLNVNLATQISDIQNQLMRFRPSLLHFSCHGGEKELLLQDRRGKAAQMTSLAKTLRLFSGHLQCVVLNACFSYSQAAEIASYIRCVVGMFPWISDRAAILFSEGFYGSLSNGLSVAAATEFGKARIALEIPGEADSPRLLASLCNPEAVYFTPAI